jgi:hypothetical protein
MILFMNVNDSHAITTAFSYQGISVDKGINLQITFPALLSKKSGLFLEISGNETAGISMGDNKHQHKNYLLWHAGWCWEKKVIKSVYWTWQFGIGTLLPKSDLENQITMTGTLRTGFEYQMSESFRSFMTLGVEMNLWNRASELVGQPYYARGTSSQFGFRYLF